MNDHLVKTFAVLAVLFAIGGWLLFQLVKTLTGWKSGHPGDPEDGDEKDDGPNG